MPKSLVWYALKFGVMSGVRFVINPQSVSCAPIWHESAAAKRRSLGGMHDTEMVNPMASGSPKAKKAAAKPKAAHKKTATKATPKAKKAAPKK